MNLQQGSRDTFSLRSIQHKDRDGKIICKTTLQRPSVAHSNLLQLQPILISQIQLEAVSSGRSIQSARSMPRSTLIASNNACEQRRWIPIHYKLIRRNAFFMLNCFERGAECILLVLESTGDIKFISYTLLNSSLVPRQRMHSTSLILAS